MTLYPITNQVCGAVFSPPHSLPTGTVSLAMAPHVRGTIGIDVTTGAIEDAKKNALSNNINNSTFIAGKAEKVNVILGYYLTLLEYTLKDI